MKTITLSAIYDGQHIRLEEEYPLPRNARLLVTLIPENAADSEEQFRWGWAALSAQGLARAYGPSEPEYPDALIKERNPDYEAR